MTSKRLWALALFLTALVAVAATTVEAKGRGNHREDRVPVIDGLFDVDEQGDDEEEQDEELRDGEWRWWPPPEDAGASEESPRLQPVAAPAVETPGAPSKGRLFGAGIVLLGAVVGAGAWIASRRRDAPPTLPKARPPRAPVGGVAVAKPAPRPAPARVPPPPAPPKAPLPPAPPLAPARPPPAPPPALRSDPAFVRGRADGSAAANLSRHSALAYLLADLHRTGADGDEIRLAPGAARAAGGKGCAYARGYLETWYEAALGRKVVVEETMHADGACALKVTW